jgi:hypothetical protein
MNFYKKIEYTTPESTQKAIQAALEDYKLVHLVGLNLQLSAHEFYTGLSNYLGWVIDMDEDKETGKKTGNRWIDISYDPAQPNKYRSSNQYLSQIMRVQLL